MYKKLLLLVFSVAVATSCSTESDEGGDQPKDKVEIDKTANRQVTGSSAADLLGDSNFTSLIVDMVYVEGFAPEAESLEIFKDFLLKRVNKPDGIEFSLRSVPSSNRAPFDRNDWEIIEDTHREFYNNGDQIAVFVYFADGEKEVAGETTPALATAYKNTSIIIFEERLRDAANWDTSPGTAIYEASALAHEFGHLFGLVNIGAPLTSDHEDGEKPTHCSTEKCLMSSPTVYSTGQTEIWTMGENCIKDLQALGGK
jgi:hypothetical protein